MSVTVSEVLIAARSGLAAVSSETAGYLVLGTADCLGDAAIGIANVYLDEDGALRLDRRAESGVGDSETGLRTVLKRLLETGRSPAPALLRVASARDKRGVRRLITEIEAALIPVNRAAARRALARLHRDVLRGKVAGKLPSSAEELFSLEPSVAPPKAVPPAPLVEKPSTEGPTPVVPSVEPIPVVVAQEFHEVPAVETVEPSPAPWVDYVPDATPFLGSLVTAPREVVALEPVAEFELDAPDTDRAPPVELDVPNDTPRFAAETAVMGTYSAAPVAPPFSLEIPVEVALTEDGPDELAEEAIALANAEPLVAEIFEEALALEDGAALPEFDVSVEPELAPFEPVFARETAVAVATPALAPGLDEKREARDALEAALLDFGDSDDMSASVEPVEPSGEGFVPMFELSPESVPGESAPDSDGPPTTDEVPAFPFALESGPAAEEPDAGLEALIDEALAVVPGALDEEPLPDSAPSVLPRVSAVAYESGTVPGLGFVNIGLVAANVQDVSLPVVAAFDAVEPPVAELESLEPPVAELESLEPPVAEPESLEPPVAEPESLEPPVAEPESLEPPVAELESLEPSFAEFEAVEPAIAEFEAMSAAMELDVFEPAVAELAADASDVFEPAVAELAADASDVFEPAVVELAADASDVFEPSVVEAAVDEPAAYRLADDELADEYAVDEYSAVEYAPVEYAVKVVQSAAAEFDALEPAIEAAAVEPSESGAIEPELAAVEPELAAVEPELAAVEPELAAVEPELAAVEPELAAVEPELAAVEPELAAVEAPVEHSPFAPEVVEPEDEPVVIFPAAEAPSYRPRRSDVADLVAAFVVAESRSLAELSRELKRIAGIGATPAPPEVASAPVRRKVSSAR